MIRPPVTCTEDDARDESDGPRPEEIAHLGQDQTGREFGPADLEVDAVRFQPGPQQPHNAPPHPQPRHTPPPGRNSGAANFPAPDHITIPCEGGGMIQATGVAQNLRPGTTLLFGHTNNMTVNHFGDGSVTKTADEASQGFKFIANQHPITSNQALPGEEHLRIVSRHVSTQWRRLGSTLGVTESTMDQMHIDFTAHGTQEMVHQMLRRWMQSCYPATLQTLAQALAKIGHGDVADMLS